MVLVSSDTQLIFTIEEGSTVKLRLYVPANGGAVIGGPDAELFAVTPSTAITYTTSANGNVFATLGYDQVPA